jgi:hypothetical protein
MAVRAAGGDPDLAGVHIAHPITGIPDGKKQIDQPKERITTDTLQIASQNYRLPPNGKEHNNNSHAEHKLIEQLKRDVPDGNWAHLAHVQLSISRMPCAMCCVDLQDWFKMILGASAAATVDVTWVQTHPPKDGSVVDFPTSAADLARLANPRVTALGPAALFATSDEATRQANGRAVLAASIRGSRR